MRLCVLSDILARRLVEEAPDKNCITLPDGSCVGKDCMHDVEEGND